MTNCQKCSGTGFQKNNELQLCRICNGETCIICKITPGRFMYPYIECKDCNGTGYDYI